ncbi:MAG: hypothetical protein E7596_00155 [Ruminococcaceae bacterium]|nr:hypothetical protein [Oscillospiraceae bacterium]
MKRQVAFNKLFNLFVIMGAVFVYGACVMLQDDPELGRSVGGGIVMLVIAAHFILVPTILMPVIYLFDEKGVTICFLFFPNERYLWENIAAIEATDDRSDSRHPILDFFFSRVFEISGAVEGKERFYMQGHIRRSRRTKRLLEKYWDGKITGYFIDDVKAWVNKKKGKKKETPVDSAKIAAMERELRAEVKEWVKPYISKAEEIGLNADLKFVYTTKNLRESNSRPKENFIYIAIVRLSKIGEKDTDKVVEVSADLMKGYTHKKEYKGVKNKHAGDELTFYLEDTLKEISGNGIESYSDK